MDAVPTSRKRERMKKHRRVWVGWRGRKEERLWRLQGGKQKWEEELKMPLEAMPFKLACIAGPTAYLEVLWIVM